MHNDQSTAARSAKRCREFEPIREREAESVLACLQGGLYAPRNVLLYLLVYELAMSARQIAATHWEDLLQSGTQTPRATLDVFPLYPNARRPKQKTVSRRLADAICAFADECGKPLEGYVFRSRSGSKLSAQSVDQVFKYWFQRVGIGRKSIASLQRLCLARSVKLQLSSYPQRRRAARRPALPIAEVHASAACQPYGDHATAPRPALDNLAREAALKSAGSLVNGPGPHSAAGGQR